MTLSEWQKLRLNTIHADKLDYGTGPDSVTVLCYYWGAEAVHPDTQFYRIESAFRETWLNCGMMKSVVVTDKPTEPLNNFAEKFPCLEIQIEPSLVPGNLYTMSADCDSRLVDRFSTRDLMIIQDDGFPLRKGIEDFIGKWDYIGAPYVRDRFLPRMAARLFNHWTMNGGFSMRSHRCCELAAKYWKEEFSTYGDVHAVGEDAYYTETLIRLRSEYRRTMRLADNRTAIRFAWDSIVPYNIKTQPFGFHRACTFETLAAKGWA